MDKRPIGYVPGKGNPLDKKVPKSKKYDYVKPTMQTGPTVNNIEVISNATIAKKKNELFKRIKVTTLSNLLNQEHSEENIYNLSQAHDEQQSQFNDNQSQYSQQSRMTEASQMSAITYATEQLGINDETSFLLLDLRDAEEHELFHIKESISYPAAMLSRDKIIAPLLRFKNAVNKLIIVYHFDEKHGIPSATLFAEKGYENVFLLNGGIEKFLQNFPEFVQGKKVPILPKPEVTQNKIMKRSNYKEVDEPVKSETKSRAGGDNKSQISQQSRITRQSSTSKQQQQQQQ